MTRAATLTALATLLVACGASHPEQPAPRSPAQPQAGTAALGGDTAPQWPRADSGSSTSRSGGEPTSQTPEYERLVADQRRKPASRFTPCNLVTRSEAQAIVGAALLVPVERPLGPTCIYSDKSGSNYMTISVGRWRFESIRPLIRSRRRLAIAGRTAYCGIYGRETLYVVLSRGRVLSVSAPCDVATRLAAKAIPRLVS